MGSNNDPKSFNLMDKDAFKVYLEKQLRLNGVNGISGSLILPQSRQKCQQKSATDKTIISFEAGKANVQKDLDMDPSTWLQYASISKTVGSAYALEVFRRFNISLDSKVNDVLYQYGSTFRLVAFDRKQSWGEDVTFRMVLSHSAALKMHYVNGIPPNRKFPCVLDLLKGEYDEEYGYPAVYVHEQPGLRFSYSGASFLILQHVLEIIEGKDISESISQFIQDDEGKLSLCIRSHKFHHDI